MATKYIAGKGFVKVRHKVYSRDKISRRVYGVPFKKLSIYNAQFVNSARNTGFRSVYGKNFSKYKKRRK